jgi:hypothetical protein
MFNQLHELYAISQMTFQRMDVSRLPLRTTKAAMIKTNSNNSHFGKLMRDMGSMTNM